MSEGRRQFEWRAQPNRESRVALAPGGTSGATVSRCPLPTLDQQAREQHSNARGVEAEERRLEGSGSRLNEGGEASESGDRDGGEEMPTKKTKKQRNRQKETAPPGNRTLINRLEGGHTNHCTSSAMGM